MTSPRLGLAAALMAGAAIVAVGCAAQVPPPAPPLTAAPPAAPPLTGTPLTQPQLDQLVAPVALYADPLLTDVMVASTYPLEVVEASRWVADPKNAQLRGDALTAALNAKDWDPAIKALVPFPPVLQMMDGHLDWTQRLGEAFLAQQADVMDAVQRLRHQAENTGALKTTPQQTVANDGEVVTIEPPPAMVYVPTYVPWCVYGPWPYPAFPPYYFAPWPGSCVPADLILDFDFGIGWPFPYWVWGRWDWHHHHIGIWHEHYQQFGHGAGGEEWHHDPVHRAGVPYRDPRNAHQFQPARQNPQVFRGYPGRDGEPAPSVHRAPPAFEGFGPGREVRTQSERGQASRQGMSGGMHGGGGGGGGRPH